MPLLAKGLLAVKYFIVLQANGTSQRPRPIGVIGILSSQQLQVERTNILKYVNVTKNFGRGHISF